MPDLTTLFSSTAKLNVLRVLWNQRDPIALRHISYLSESPLYSVQRALKQLEDEAIISKSKYKNRILYQLVPGSPYYFLLDKVFDAEQKNEIDRRSKNYSSQAKQALEFASSTNQFFNKLKNTK